MYRSRALCLGMRARLLAQVAVMGFDRFSIIASLVGPLHRETAWLGVGLRAD